MSVFIDANIVMYLIGAPHPNRERAKDLLDELIVSGTRMVTDAEVYQEVLHRYSAIRRPEAIGPAFTALDQLADEVFPIRRDEITAAKTLVLEGAGARDALHAATMRSNGTPRILTFDRGFDRFADLERLS